MSSSIISKIFTQERINKINENSKIVAQKIKIQYNEGDEIIASKLMNLTDNQITDLVIKSLFKTLKIDIENSQDDEYKYDIIEDYIGENYNSEYNQANLDSYVREIFYDYFENLIHNLNFI